MKDKTDDDIKQSLLETRKWVERYMGPSVEVTCFDNMVNYHNPSLMGTEENRDSYGLFCLGNGLANVMAHCNYIVFAPGWNDSRGCIVEMIAATMYGKPAIALNRNVDDGELYKVSQESIDDMLKIRLQLERYSNEA
jgi:hypothetical protein